MADAAREHAEALDAADPLGSFRSRFVVDDDVVYVDGNSLGRLPRAVSDRVSSTLGDWGTQLVSAWTDWIDLPTDVGDRLASVALGAAPGQVLVTRSRWPSRNSL